MSRWNFDPLALVVLVMLALLTVRSRTAAAAMIVLAFAFLSPLCALSSALFSARIVHHILLVAVAAPLLAFSRPSGVVRGAGLPFLIATAALWLWHVPVAYDGALANMALYWVMQASLFGAAWWFWRALLSQPAGVAILWIVFAYMAMGLLGALLTFAPDPIYATHVAGPTLWGMSSLGDQQLGGLLMWVPAGLVYAVWALVIGRRGWRDMGEAA